MSLRIEVLEEAYTLLVETVNVNASVSGMSEEDKRELLKLINDAYLDKKLEYFVEDRLDKIDAYLHTSLSDVLDGHGVINSKQDYSISYIKRLQQLTVNG